MPKKRRKRRKKPKPIPEKNPILYLTSCPVCHTFNAFCVRESRGEKKQHYARCNHCALLMFGQDAIYTYLRQMRYNLRFEAGTREDLDDFFGKTLDLRSMQHPVYLGVLQKKAREASIVKRRKQAEARKAKAKQKAMQQRPAEAGRLDSLKKIEEVKRKNVND